MMHPLAVTPQTDGKTMLKINTFLIGGGKKKFIIFFFQIYFL
jgi:hypothetical protein